MARPWTDRPIKDWDDMLDLLNTCWNIVDPEQPDARRTSAEVEVNLTGPHGELLDCNSGPVTLLMQADETGRVARDFTEYMPEAAPPDNEVWDTADAARRGIIALYDALLAAESIASDILADVKLGHQVRRMLCRDLSCQHDAEAIEFAQCWDALHVQTIADGDCWEAHRIHATEPEGARYEFLKNRAIPSLYLGATSTGFQVHVQNCLPLDDRFFRMRMATEQWTPLLLAASANSYSPIRRAHSLRYLHFKSLTSVGCFGWQRRDDFERTLRIQHEDGFIQGPHDLHNWVKICGREQGYSTTEMRICDSVSSVLEAVALHGVCHALIWHYSMQVRNWRRPYFMERPRESVRLRRGLEAAAAHGLSRLETLIPCPHREGVASMGQLFEELEALIGPTMEQLGYDWEREYFFRTMVGSQSNGAMRQREWWSSGELAVDVLTRDRAYLRESLVEARELFGAARVAA